MLSAVMNDASSIWIHVSQHTVQFAGQSSSTSSRRTGRGGCVQFSPFGPVAINTYRSNIQEQGGHDSGRDRPLLPLTSSTLALPGVPL